MKINQTSLKYSILSEELRPQDDTFDGKNLAFILQEHGGDFPDAMPQVIKVIDKNGNWCNYVPEELNGELIRGYGYNQMIIDECEE